MLNVRELKTHFTLHRERRDGHTPTVKAVDGVSLTLGSGEILGLVGESGCGKSTLARSIVQLIPPTAGTITVDGVDLTTLKPRQLRQARTGFQMIFQDPYASLNPRMTVFDAVAEPMHVHGVCTKAELPGAVSTLMTLVGLEPRFMHKFPHEFSGGQRQRIAIARAIAVKPKLLIADEPVSALDVSIQAQILNLLMSLCRDLDMAMIFISHDLSVVQHIADRVAVMYLGRIVETGPTDAIFAKPLHPYTQALLSAIPHPDPDVERDREHIVLAGDPPSPVDPPAGCPFHTRCGQVIDKCRTTVPKLRKFEGSEVACLLVQ